MLFVDIIRFFFVSTGMWKSPIEHPSTFAYSDPSRGRGDVFRSASFSPGTRDCGISYSDNGSLAPISSKSRYWSNQVEAGPEPFTPVSKDTCEKKQGNGYRLFGIELLEHCMVEDISLVVASGEAAAEDRHDPSHHAESDQHSEPSNVNQADIPSESCEPEKSCLRILQESHSRQTRSCTKVL